MIFWPDLFRCAACGSEGTLRPNGVATTCSRCGSLYRISGNILDFVAGSENTALDVDEYDEHMGVSIESSQHLFSDIKRLSCGLFPEHLGSVLEIGAGTGYFTMGMLSQSSFDRAVITDISPDMLRVIDGRISRYLADQQDKTLLATYCGQNIFAANAFDVVVGNSVVHHIFDVKTFFKGIRRAIRLNGVAIFVEPATLFHEALTCSLSDAIVSLIARSAVTLEDVRVLSAWVEQTRFRLREPEDSIELSRLEDKHMFTRDKLNELAQEAGFARTTILPVGFDKNGAQCATAYARHFAPAAILATLIDAYEKKASYFFDKLSIEDTSQMYIIGMHAK